MDGENNYFDLRRFLSQDLCCVNPVQFGHCDIHENNVGLGQNNPVQCRATIGRFAYHANILVKFQQGAQTVSQNPLIVNEIDVDHVCFAIRRMIFVPAFGADWTSSVASRARARSRMMASPQCDISVERPCGSKPTPLSLIVILKHSLSSLISISTFVAFAYLATLLSASCTMRNKPTSACADKRSALALRSWTFTRRLVRWANCSPYHANAGIKP